MKTLRTLSIFLVTGTAMLWLGLQFWWVTIDDPWIAYRYAANLARGEGLVFNPGERVEGYSSLLMVLLAALPLRLGIEPDRPLRALSLGLAALTPGLLYLFTRRTEAARRLPGAPGLLTVLGALLLALSYPWAAWSVGGLETTLHALAAGAALAVFALEEKARVDDPECPARLRWSFLLLFLVCLTRIEGPMVFCGVLAAIALRCLLERRPPRRDTLAGIGVFLLLIGGYTLFRLAYFGSLMPNTFHAKATGPLAEQILKGLRYLHGFYRGNGGWSLLPILLPPALLLWRALAGRYPLTARAAAGRRLNFSERLWLLLLCQLAVHGGFVVYVGGDWMGWHRFVVHFLPLLYFALQEGWMLGLDRLAQWLGPRRRRAYWALALLALGLLAWKQTQRGPLPRRHATEGVMDQPWAERYCGLDGYFAVGRWLREHTRPDALIAGCEAGIYPYISGRPFLDLFGLVDPYIARRQGGHGMKFDADYIFERDPDWVVAHAPPDWLPNQGPKGLYYTEARLLEDPRFAERYRLRHKILRRVPYNDDNYFCIYKRVDPEP